MGGVFFGVYRLFKGKPKGKPPSVIFLGAGSLKEDNKEVYNSTENQKALIAPQGPGLANRPLFCSPGPKYQRVRCLSDMFLSHPPRKQTLNKQNMAKTRTHECARSGYILTPPWYCFGLSPLPAFRADRRPCPPASQPPQKRRSAPPKRLSSGGRSI